ncbi:MAG TPA: MG2 domain-containing protein [Pyrinomonadaceae bacterium]|nr:MG2 domain-containing protein [Pyrinomonadaceae bacterium]
MSRRTLLTSAAVYVSVALLLFGFVVLRVKTGYRFAAETAPDSLPYNGSTPTPPDPHAKPFFSLHTNRTYATTDRARVWVNYRGVESLDFRVYKVKDPVKFFLNLENPHQVGEDEQAEVGEQIKRKPTFLEKLRAFKSRAYGAVKSYVRAQLRNQSRKGFNQKFRPEEDDTSNRTPLNQSDFARVPLLNPDQMVTNWREKLPPLEDVYDRRMISLGKREPGVYLVEAVSGDLRCFGIVLVTDLATVQKTSADGQMLVYAVERRSGEPREGVRVQVIRRKNELLNATTDKAGLARLKIEKPKRPAQEEDEEGEEEEEAPEAEPEAAPEETVNNSYLVMATEGENFAISDLDSYYFGGEYEGEYEEGGDGAGSLTSYIYTDRPVYRPEQKVYFKGILRDRVETGYKLPAGKTVAVTVSDGQGAQIFEQELPLSTRGTFSGELDLPEESPLGYYSLNATLGDASANGSFQVEEYKKPEYKVRVTTAQSFVGAGQTARVTVSANYFFGAPVARAAVKYYVYRSRSYGWWRGGGDEDSADEFGADPTAEEDGDSYGGYSSEMVAEGDGKTNEQGRYDIEFKVPEPNSKDAWDYSYSVQAQVTDPARRTMDGSVSFTGVRSDTTAYAYPEHYIYYQGDAARINVTARARDGRPAQTRVKLTFYERRWEKVMKRSEYGDEYADYETREKELASAVVQTNEQGEAAYDYQIPGPGSILIKTTIEEQGRSVTTEAGAFWAADRTGEWADVSYPAEGEIELKADKKSYRPGETARVLALLPKDNAHLLVTTELDRVLNTWRVDAKGRAVTIDVPIEPRYAPNVFLNVTYVRGSEMYTAELMLVVPARDKLLDLQIVPNKKEFRPRETASYTLLARNGDGSPAAGAEVSFGVVDESIYQIAAESVEDIRRAFYGRRYNSVQTSFSVNYYFSGYAGTKTVNLAQHKKPYRLADFKNDDAANPLVRKIFKDTAYWQPAVVTGPDGKATVKVELPDNLTTWRATARAVTADTRVGVAVSRVVERKDVIIRAAMPRFLTAGDTVTISGIVHNYLKTEKVTKITLDVAGAKLLDPPAQTVTIPSQGEHRVNWRVSAPSTGDLKILAKALTDTESDALETGIPIHPRGLKSTQADSFVISEDEADKVVSFKLPANADPNARSFRIDASPSVAGTLFGALDYLTSFPYGCTEQTMSSFLPNVIVTQALQNVQTATVRDTNDIGKKVRRGMRRLYGFQHADGGWGWWKDDPTTVWMTAYVVDGLTQASRAGYEVDEERLQRGRQALLKMLESGADGRNEGLTGEGRAYAAYSLALGGPEGDGHLDKVFNERAKLNAYARALLALALKERGDERRSQTVAGEIEASAKAAGAESHWDADAEATALSVKALARTRPASEVLPRAARWLVGHRRFGYYWRSTRETAFAVYGLIDYLKASRELEADYTLEVYVNGEQVLQRQVTGSDASSGEVFTFRRKGGEVGPSSEVRFVKRGRGVLYLATTLVHYTNDEQVAAAGVPQLRLTREYFRLNVVEKSEGQLGWQLEPLKGDVRSGDTIVSRLRVEGEKAEYLLIEDPIPAGCEQVEEVGGLNLNHTQEGWTDWYSAREFRDNRAALFLNYFDGSAQFQYAMRVQVPGQFRVAPARAERMYEPEVHANSAGGALNILDK